MTLAGSYFHIILDVLCGFGKVSKIDHGHGHPKISLLAHAFQREGFSYGYTNGGESQQSES